MKVTIFWDLYFQFVDTFSADKIPKTIFGDLGHKGEKIKKELASEKFYVANLLQNLLQKPIFLLS